MHGAPDSRSAIYPITPRRESERGAALRTGERALITYTVAPLGCWKNDGSRHVWRWLWKNPA
jgi:hypothetical protein